MAAAGYLEEVDFLSLASSLSAGIQPGKKIRPFLAVDAFASTGYLVVARLYY